MCTSHEKPAATLIDESTMNDEKLIASLCDKISIHTHPFSVYQFRVRDRGFLFIQCLSPLYDFRYTSATNHQGQKLDREIVVHYITMSEFENDVMKNHPSPSLKKAKVVNEVRSVVNSYNPKKQVLCVVLFACDKVVVVNQELLSYNTLENSVDENKEKYEAEHELNIFIDRN
jgi:hypothetical protein